MNRFTKKWSSLTLVFCIGLAMRVADAQTIYSSGSYNSNSMMSEVSIPANHFTGVPNISIPLFSLPGKALNVPVSLSYHAGGHKVNEPVNWVGLGWNLQVGGVITRVVRGLPDEVTNGYCGTHQRGSLASNNLAANTTNYSYLGNIQSETWDGQPDDFYFNVMGISGKFVIDHYGKAYTIPSSNTKIKPGICGGTEWVIIDESGTRYIFENSSSSTEVTTVKYMGNVVSTHTTAWYLTRIETPNQTEEITFSYQSGGTQKTKHIQSVKYEHVAGDDDRSCLNFSDYYNIDYNTTVTKVINTITSSLGSVTFVPSYNKRLDLQGNNSLSRIEVFDNSGNLVRSFWLNYGYFYADTYAPHDENTRRLKLESIYDEGRLIASFNYNESTKLPSREDSSTDHWGFYGNSYLGYPEIDHPVYGHFSGTDRSTNSSRVLANLISEINYGSGASVRFTFEANQYYHAAAGANKYAGGARIASIISSPGTGQPSQTTTYEYNDFNNTSRSSGKLYAEPLYYEGIVTGATGGTANDVLLKRYMYPVGFLSSEQGIRVGYSNVAVVTGLGKTKYTFRDLQSHENHIHTLWLNNGGIITKNTAAFYGTVSINVPFIDGWGGGLLEKKEIIKSDGTPVIMETYEYNLNPEIIKTIYGVVAEKRNFTNCTQNGLLASGYSIKVKPILLTKRKITQYDPDNSSLTITNVTEYDYLVDVNGFFNEQIDVLLNSTSSYNENYPGLKYLEYFQYPGSYPVTGLITFGDVLGGIQELWRRNVRTIPIESYSIVDDHGTQTLNGVTYQTFQKIGAYGDEEIYPHQLYRFLQRIPASQYMPSHADLFTFVPPNVSLELVSTSVYEENTGRLTTGTSFNGSTINYNYDDLGLLASINTTHDQLSRNTSVSSQAFTGPGSVTDANNRSIFNTYDKKQRLSTVSDHDGNIIGRKRYIEGNTVAVLIDGPVRTNTNTPVTFYVSDPFEYGTTTFKWEMDDGTTYTTTNRSINHTYTGVGVMKIKVTATNDEADFSVAGNRGLITESYNPPIPPLNIGSIVATTVSTTTCSTTLTFSISASGTCSSNYVFNWRYRLNSGTWISFNPSSPTEFTHFGDTNLDVEVAVTNPGCGNGDYKTQSLQLFLDGCFGHPDDY